MIGDPIKDLLGELKSKQVDVTEDQLRYALRSKVSAENFYNANADKLGVEHDFFMSHIQPVNDDEVALKKLERDRGVLTQKSNSLKEQFFGSAGNYEAAQGKKTASDYFSPDVLFSNIEGENPPTVEDSIRGIDDTTAKMDSDIAGLSKRVIDSKKNVQNPIENLKNTNLPSEAAYGKLVQGKVEDEIVNNYQGDVNKWLDDRRNDLSEYLPTDTHKQLFKTLEDGDKIKTDIAKTQKAREDLLAKPDKSESDLATIDLLDNHLKWQASRSFLNDKFADQYKKDLDKKLDENIKTYEDQLSYEKDPEKRDEISKALHKEQIRKAAVLDDNNLIQSLVPDVTWDKIDLMLDKPLDPKDKLAAYGIALDNLVKDKTKQKAELDSKIEKLWGSQDVTGMRKRSESLGSEIADLSDQLEDISPIALLNRSNADDVTRAASVIAGHYAPDAHNFFQSVAREFTQDEHLFRPNYKKIQVANDILESLDLLNKTTPHYLESSESLAKPTTQESFGEMTGASLDLMKDVVIGGVVMKQAGAYADALLEIPKIKAAWDRVNVIKKVAGGLPRFSKLAGDAVKEGISYQIGGLIDPKRNKQGDLSFSQGLAGGLATGLFEKGAVRVLQGLFGKDIDRLPVFFKHAIGQGAGNYIPEYVEENVQNYDQLVGEYTGKDFITGSLEMLADAFKDTQRFKDFKTDFVNKIGSWQAQKDLATSIAFLSFFMGHTIPLAMGGGLAAQFNDLFEKHDVDKSLVKDISNYLTDIRSLRYGGQNYHFDGKDWVDNDRVPVDAEIAKKLGVGLKGESRTVGGKKIFFKSGQWVNEDNTPVDKKTLDSVINEFKTREESSPLVSNADITLEERKAELEAKADKTEAEANELSNINDKLNSIESLKSGLKETVTSRLDTEKKDIESKLESDPQNADLQKRLSDINDELQVDTKKETELNQQKLDLEQKLSVSPEDEQVKANLENVNNHLSKIQNRKESESKLSAEKENTRKQITELSAPVKTSGNEIDLQGNSIEVKKGSVIRGDGNTFGNAGKRFVANEDLILDKVGENAYAIRSKSPISGSMEVTSMTSTKLSQAIKNASTPTKRALKLIRELIPFAKSMGVRIYLHDNDSFINKVGELARGVYRNREVHINLSHVRANTGVHEILHPFFNALFERVPELKPKFFNGLSDLYKEYSLQSGQTDEGIVEYAADQIAYSITPLLDRDKGFFGRVLDYIRRVLIDLGFTKLQAEKIMGVETDLSYLINKLAGNIGKVSFNVFQKERIKIKPTQSETQKQNVSFNRDQRVKDVAIKYGINPDRNSISVKSDIEKAYYELLNRDHTNQNVEGLEGELIRGRQQDSLDEWREYLRSSSMDIVDQANLFHDVLKYDYGYRLRPTNSEHPYEPVVDQPYSMDMPYKHEVSGWKKFEPGLTQEDVKKAISEIERSTVGTNSDLSRNAGLYLDKGNVWLSENNWAVERNGVVIASFADDIDDLLIQIPENQYQKIGGFYSPLSKKISQFKQESYPAKKWLEIVGSGDESVFTGLRDYLSSKNGTDKITKGEVLKYLHDHKIVVNTIVKGGTEIQNLLTEKKRIEDEINNTPLPPDIQKQKDLVAKLGNSVEEATFRATDYIDASDKLDAMYEEFFSEQYDLLNQIEFELGREDTKTGYGDRPELQVPGPKEDYQETLVTLPYKNLSLNANDYKVFVTSKSVNSDSRDVYILKNRKIVSRQYRVTEDDATIISDYIKEQKERFALEQKKNAFKSSHFEEPNILAHSRSNIRIDKDGNKVWFVEELQSDWGAQFRKEGLGVAPYVTETPAWTKLILKTNLQQAVAAGADKIAWTTGEQQNERYDLSKQIKSVSASKNNDGTYQLVAEDPQGNEIEGYSRSGAQVTPVELESLVGKELAQKLMEGADKNKGREWKKSMRNNPEFFTVSGIDLKIGGKGMLGYYGSPSKGKLGIVGEVAKSLFGNIGTTEIDTSHGTPSNETYFGDWKTRGTQGGLPVIGATVDGVEWQISPNGKDKYSLYKNETRIGIYDTISEAKKAAENYNPDKYSVNHSVDITPEIRRQVAEGLPQFQKIPNETNKKTKSILSPFTDEQKRDESRLNAQRREEAKRTIYQFRDEGILVGRDGKMSSEQIDAQFTLLDAMANTWNRVTGHDNFYTQFVGTISKGDISDFKDKGFVLYQDETNPHNLISRVTLAVFEDPAVKKLSGSKTNKNTLLNLFKNRGKQMEKDIIFSVLDSYGDGKFDFNTFRNDVEFSIMKLENIKSKSYNDHGVDNVEMRRDLDSMYTIILNSPLNHGDVGHFLGDFDVKEGAEWELKQIPGRDLWVAIAKDAPPLTAENIQSYVGTAGSEGEVARWIEERNAGFGILNKGLFGHYRVWKLSDEDYFIPEMQSDYFQKRSEDLAQVPEQEVTNYMYENFYKELNKEYSYKFLALYPELEIKVEDDFYVGYYKGVNIGYTPISEYFDRSQSTTFFVQKINNRTINMGFSGEDIRIVEEKVNSRLVTRHDFSTQEEVDSFRDSFYEKRLNDSNKFDELKEEYDERKKGFADEKQKYINKRKRELLGTVSNTAQMEFLASRHFDRIWKEALAHAANEGAKYVYLPSGFTIAKIEGWLSGQGEADVPYETDGDLSDRREGDEINYGGVTHTVVEADSTNIWVVPTDDLNSYHYYDFIRSESEYYYHELERDAKKQFVDINAITKEEADSYAENESYAHIVSRSLEDAFEGLEEGDTVDFNDLNIEDDIESDLGELDYRDLFGDRYTWSVGEFVYTSGTAAERLLQPDQYDVSEEVNDSNYLENFYNTDNIPISKKYEKHAEAVLKSRPGSSWIQHNSHDWLKVPIQESDKTVLAFQNNAGRIKGAIDINQDGPANFYLFDGADISTLAHEFTGHLGRVLLEKLAEHDESFANDYAEAKKWAGVKDRWTVKAEEKFARGFEKYLRNGKAPIKALKNIFDLFRDWLTDIYRKIKGSPINVRLSPKITKVFDNLLAQEDQFQRIGNLLKREVTFRPDEIGSIDQYDVQQRVTNKTADERALKSIGKMDLYVNGDVMDYERIEAKFNEIADSFKPFDSNNEKELADGLSHIKALFMLMDYAKLDGSMEGRILRNKLFGRISAAGTFLGQTIAGFNHDLDNEFYSLPPNLRQEWDRTTPTNTDKPDGVKRTDAEEALYILDSSLNPEYEKQIQELTKVVDNLQEEIKRKDQEIKNRSKKGDKVYEEGKKKLRTALDKLKKANILSSGGINPEQLEALAEAFFAVIEMTKGRIVQAKEEFLDAIKEVSDWTDEKINEAFDLLANKHVDKIDEERRKYAVDRIKKHNSKESTNEKSFDIFDTLFHRLKTNRDQSLKTPVQKLFLEFRMEEALVPVVNQAINDLEVEMMSLYMEPSLENELKRMEIRRKVDQLREFVDDITGTTRKDNLSRAAVRKGLRDAKATIRQVIYDHFTEKRVKDGLAEEIARALDTLSLSEDEAREIHKFAQQVEDVVMHRFDTDIAAAKEAEIAKLSKTFNAGNIVKAMKLGALNNNAFLGAISAHLGEPNVTPHILRVMKMIHLLAHQVQVNANGSLVQNASSQKAIRMLNLLKSHLSATGMQKFRYAFLNQLYVNMLSGPMTTLASLYGAGTSMVKFFPEAIVRLGINSSQRNLALVSMWEAMKDARDGMMKAWDYIYAKRDRQALTSEESRLLARDAFERVLTKNYSEIFKNVEDPGLVRIGKLVLKPFLEAIHTMYRVFVATDIFTSTIMEGWNERMEIYDQYLAASGTLRFSTKDIIQHLNEEMGYTTALKNRIDAEISKAGYTGARAIAYRAKRKEELRGEYMRDHVFKEISELQTARQLSLQRPEGILGKVYDVIPSPSAIREDSGTSAMLLSYLGRLIMPFSRMALNHMNRYMSNSGLSIFGVPPTKYNTKASAIGKYLSFKETRNLPGGLGGRFQEGTYITVDGKRQNLIFTGREAAFEIMETAAFAMMAQMVSYWFYHDDQDEYGNKVNVPEGAFRVTGPAIGTTSKDKEIKQYRPNTLQRWTKNKDYPEGHWVDVINYANFLPSPWFTWQGLKTDKFVFDTYKSGAEIDGEFIGKFLTASAMFPAQQSFQQGLRTMIDIMSLPDDLLKDVQGQGKGSSIISTMLKQATVPVGVDWWTNLIQGIIHAPEKTSTMPWAGPLAKTPPYSLAFDKYDFDPFGRQVIPEVSLPIINNVNEGWTKHNMTAEEKALEDIKAKFKRLDNINKIYSYYYIGDVVGDKNDPVIENLPVEQQYYTKKLTAYIYGQLLLRHYDNAVEIVTASTKDLPASFNTALSKEIQEIKDHAVVAAKSKILSDFIYEQLRDVKTNPYLLEIKKDSPQLFDGDKLIGDTTKRSKKSKVSMEFLDMETLLQDLSKTNAEIDISEIGFPKKDYYKVPLMENFNNIKQPQDATLYSDMWPTIQEYMQVSGFMIDDKGLNKKKAVNPVKTRQVLHAN